LGIQCLPTCLRDLTIFVYTAPISLQLGVPSVVQEMFISSMV